MREEIIAAYVPWPFRLVGRNVFRGPEMVSPRGVGVNWIEPPEIEIVA